MVAGELIGRGKGVPLLTKLTTVLSAYLCTKTYKIFDCIYLS